MALSKNKIRKIPQRNRLGSELTRKDCAVQYGATIAICIFVIPAYIFIIKVIPISIPELIIIVIPVIFFGALFTFLFFNLIFKARTSDRSERELVQIEEQQEIASKKILIEKLDKRIFFDLNPTANAMNIHQTELCKDLLMQDEVNDDEELKFYLCLKLYWFHYIDGDYPKAIDSLKLALGLKPKDILTNIRLAEAYELIGSGDKAIDTYKIVGEFQDISANLKIYIKNQVKRVNRHGPRRGPPMTGFRYMTY